MDLVITGHTSGIGSYIYGEYCLHYGTEIIGLSRSTGFDITKDNISKYITPQTTFINNAFSFDDPDAQSNILDQAIHASKIICIGTNSQWEGVYKDAKERLKQKCHEYFVEGKDVTYLALGKVDTPYTQEYHPNDDVINKGYLMDCIEFILNSEYRIEILSVRPD
tara:strand:- start:7507 stop:8001 length:495 start_codon:yes stop_codon:yes gene_type:complete